MHVVVSEAANRQLQELVDQMEARPHDPEAEEAVRRFLATLPGDYDRERHVAGELCHVLPEGYAGYIPWSGIKVLEPSYPDDVALAGAVELVVRWMEQRGHHALAHDVHVHLHTPPMPDGPHTSSERIELRCSPAELEQWQAAADANERTLEDWIHRVLGTESGRGLKHGGNDQ